MDYKALLSVFYTYNLQVRSIIMYEYVFYVFLFEKSSYAKCDFFPISDYHVSGHVFDLIKLIEE
jgi:hypothetical protein